MAKKSNKKRILMILELLYKHSDEKKYFSTNDIINHLTKNNIEADRKTVADDIQEMIERGYDIVTVKSSPNKYFWGSRTFQIPELRLLIDAVCSSRFITDQKSKELTDKLISQAGSGQKDMLSRHISATGRAKTDNQYIYYSVDWITETISENKKLEFQYYEYNVHKQKVLRNNGEKYKISPYALYWNEDFYYVMGYSEKRKKVTVFRVDRMCSMKMLDEKAAPKPRDFNEKDYADRIFGMFSSNEKITVELECRNELMKYIIDRYGLEVTTTIKTPETFVAKVPVHLSPIFFSWVFQFGGKMKILSPEVAAKEYSEMLKSCLEIQGQK